MVQKSPFESLTKLRTIRFRILKLLNRDPVKKLKFKEVKHGRKIKVL